MENGVLNLMHKCYQQGEPFKQVIRDGRTFYKILDFYFPAETPSNLKSLDGSTVYSVGSIALYFNNRENTSVYDREVRENELDLIPRPHRRSLANFIQTGQQAGDLVIEENATTVFIPAVEFESTVVHQDVEMTDLLPKASESEVKKPVSEVSASQMRDLNQDLTADKLALLASKAKQVRAQKGKATERILPIDQEGPEKMDPFDRFIKYKTRSYKTCINILDTNADFSSILTLLNAKPKESNSSMIPKPPVAPNLQSSQASRIGPASGYSRYDQEVFNPSEDPFNIQIGMSFHGKSLKMNNKMDPKPVAEPIARPMKRPLAYPTTTSSSKSAKRTSRTPIIIVPATGTALITIYNATDILQELKFITTEEKKKELTRRENELLIQRRKDGGQTVPYRIVDNPLKLSPEEWDRVVAVFVQGPAWQFKDWHWGGNPTEIFSHVCGFHLKYEDTKLDPNVAKWSVDVLQLSKTKRHLDKAIFIRLWQKIEQFIIRNKPDLRY